MIIEDMKNINKGFGLMLFFAISCLQLMAQETTYIDDTFKSTRVLNGHSIELLPEGILDFRVEHRFGRINQGYYEFFGLDQSNSFLALEYGIKDWMQVGLNRTSLNKTVSGFAKFSLLRQSTGARNMPVSISALIETSIDGMKWTIPERNNLFSSRVSYVSQFILARKFNDHFSLQLSPIWIHRNLVPTVLDKNDAFALGIASRYNISDMSSFNVEYYPVFGSSWNHSTNYKNALSIGFDIKTNRHVFQLMLSNTMGMIEKSFVTETTGNWLKGDLHLGFNISRVFSLK